VLVFVVVQNGKLPILWSLEIFLKSHQSEGINREKSSEERVNLRKAEIKEVE